MGFGSYDESEQANRETRTEDEGESVRDHEHVHEGESTFETDATTAELIDRLGEMKDEE